MIGEYIDGGYWYVVPVVINSDGEKTPGEIPGGCFAAWYGEDYGLDPNFVTIRTPQPVDLPNAVDLPISEVLKMAGLSQVPDSRIGGV